MFLSILVSSRHDLQIAYGLTLIPPSLHRWEAFPTPRALTHIRITWALSPTAPQVPGVILRSPLRLWYFGHSSWRGARHFRPYLYVQRFTLVTIHQPLRWFMESDKLTGKLGIWVLLLQEYDFEMVYHTGITNLDANGLPHNSNPLDEDLTGAKWHGDCDREAVPCWHATAYVTLFYGATIEVPMQSSDDETNRLQAIADIWEDLLVLHKLQQGPFLRLSRQ